MNFSNCKQHRVGTEKHCHAVLNEQKARPKTHTHTHTHTHLVTYIVSNFKTNHLFIFPRLSC
jgi:hypothetical protein